MVKDRNTERIILDAAQRVFLKKGIMGARMQEIADEAGMNKALLHYYFRSKEKLFDHILESVIKKISDGLRSIFQEDMSVKDRLVAITDVYIDVLSENRYLPIFVLTEINHNPQKIGILWQEHLIVHLGGFMEQIQREAEEGLIKAIPPLHLLLNVLGMIIFPVAAFPLVKEISKTGGEYFLQNFLNERKLAVKQFIGDAIKP